MSEIWADPLADYASQGQITAPGALGRLFDSLPTDVPGLCRALQGVMIHIFWAERYGISLSDERKGEVMLRAVAPKLARLVEINDQPLTFARPPQRRLVGNCRDFSTVLTSILRHRDIPARARCGFGAYFMPNHYEDHWICEYWKAEEERWVMVDPQIDDLMRGVLGIRFDTCDMPFGQFVMAGEGWRLCREGKANPDDFGIFQWKGLGFIRGNMLRDLASLNKIETLPWDRWGLMLGDKDKMSEGELALLDRLAAITPTGARDYEGIRKMYESEPALRAPSIEALVRGDRIGPPPPAE